MEVSYKTVQRLMKKLVHLEMIKQVAMKRTKDMLQTSNAIIIQPIVEEVSNKVDAKVLQSVLPLKQPLFP